MKGSINVQNRRSHYDKEWFRLIKEAKDIGLTPSAIRLFLKKQSSDTLVKNKSRSSK